MFLKIIIQNSNFQNISMIIILYNIWNVIQVITCICNVDYLSSNVVYHHIDANIVYHHIEAKIVDRFSHSIIFGRSI